MGNIYFYLFFHLSSLFCVCHSVLLLYIILLNTFCISIFYLLTEYISHFCKTVFYSFCSSITCFESIRWKNTFVQNYFIVVSIFYHINILINILYKNYAYKYLYVRIKSLEWIKKITYIRTYSGYIYTSNSCVFVMSI